MEKTIFEKIIAREEPGSFIYEDDVVAVIRTIGPLTPGHAMVIPKKPYVGLDDMDEQTGAHIFKIAQRAAKAIRQSGLKREGITLFLADGAAAFQEVFHFPLHVFPPLCRRSVQGRGRLGGAACTKGAGCRGGKNQGRLRCPVEAARGQRRRIMNGSRR